MRKTRKEFVDDEDVVYRFYKFSMLFSIEKAVKAIQEVSRLGLSNVNQMTPSQRKAIESCRFADYGLVTRKVGQFDVSVDDINEEVSSLIEHARESLKDKTVYHVFEKAYVACNDYESDTSFFCDEKTCSIYLRTLYVESQEKIIKSSRNIAVALTNDYIFYRKHQPSKAKKIFDKAEKYIVKGVDLDEGQD